MEYLLMLSVVALIASSVLTLVFMVRSSDGAKVWGRALLGIGAGMLAVYFFLQFVYLGYFPLRTLKDSFVFLALLLIIANALTIAFMRLDVLNLIVSPLVAAVLLVAFFFANNTKSPDALVYLRNYLAVLHIPIFILGYAFFIVSAVLSIFYLILDREMKHKDFSRISHHFPPLLRIDRYINYFIWLGFILLTLGIVTGALFAWQASYAFNYADPKVIFVFFIWLYYFAYIHRRMRGGWVGKRTCYAALAGCALIFVAYFATNLLFTSVIHGFR
jgi:ABC-type uncharacterized transport system permease subunit